MESIHQDEELVWVDWHGGDLEALERQGFKHTGPDSYLICPLTEANIFSDKYINCTGVLALGTDKVTGNEIAFLSHQDPKVFKSDNEIMKEKFAIDLKESFAEIRRRSKEGTLDILVLGGNYDRTNPVSVISRDYIDSIQSLGNLIQEELGVNPTVLTGPNIHIGSGTDVTVETQTHKVFIERSEQPPEVDAPYKADVVKEEENIWLGSL